MFDFQSSLILFQESVADMLIALEEILRSENEKVSWLAVDLTVKLVSSLGRSICHYHMHDIVISLSSLLPTCQVPGAILCTTALNRILNNLGPMSCQNLKELWEAVEKTNLVGSIVSAMQDHGDGIQPTEYFTEMASLLRTIIWMWSPVRYHIWSNTKLMDRLSDNCCNNETSVTVSVLQLYSALGIIFMVILLVHLKIQFSLSFLYVIFSVTNTSISLYQLFAVMEQ